MRKRAIVLSLVLGMLLAAILPPVSAWGCDERTAEAVKAPKWAINDQWSWRMDKTVKFLNSYTDENGTLNITYTRDEQNIDDMVVAVEGPKYRMSYTEFEWLNGTWNFKPSPVGEGNGWLESNGTIRATFDKTGVRYRTVSDFSLVNATVSMAYRYGSLRLDGNYRVFNWSGNETHALSSGVTPLNTLKFPLTPGDGWGVDCNITDSYFGTKEWPDYPLWGTPSYSGSRYDHYVYCVTVAPDTETKLVQAKSYDCYKLSDLGRDDWGWTEGALSGQGSTFIGHNRWWSREAGTTINTNETTVLRSFIHVANLAPLLDIIPTQIVEEDMSFNIQLAPFAHDLDLVNDTGDFLKYNATSTDPITGQMIDELTGELRGNPTQEDVGTHYITLTVTDSFGAKATKGFSLNVLNLNDPPRVIGHIDNVTMYENVTLDTDILLDQVFGDPDPPLLDSLTFGFSGNGSVQIFVNEDTRVKLVSPDIFAPGTPVLVNVTARDTGSGNESAQQEVWTTMNITILHRDHRPVSSAIPAITIEEDSPAYVLDLAPFFDDVDISYAGDSLQYTSSGLRKVSVSIQGSNASLLPSRDWNGLENITFIATDTADMSACSTVAVRVRPVNDAPVVQLVGTTPDSKSVTMPEAVDGVQQEQRFVLNASDPDGDPLSNVWTVVNGAGKKVLETKGITFVLRTSYVGDISSTGSPFTVTARVSDGNLTASRNWTVNVTNTDRKPTAVISAPSPGAKFQQKKTVTLDGSQSSDEDQTSGSLRYEWTSSLNGKLGTGAVLNVSDLKKGAHTISLVVTDNESESSTATVIVTITAPPAPQKGFLPGFEAIMVIAGIALLLAVTRKRKID